MNRSIEKQKGVIAVISLILIGGYCIFKMDFHDLSIGNNLWQYIAILLSFLGCLGVCLFSKASVEIKKKGAFVVWLLAILYFLFVVISSIVTRDFDWKFWLIAILLLVSTSLTLKDYTKKDGV